MDTLRADRLGCYGHWRDTSPTLDQLAREGVRFESCFSPHIPTFPGHTTMFTGKDVYTHLITGQGGGAGLPVGVRTLPEMLSEAGYYCAAADNLGRWFTLGMDLVQGYSWDTSGTEWRKAEAVNKAAFEVLDAAAAQDKPFFLFLHYWDAHTPYLPPAPFNRMFYEGDEKDPNNHSMDELWAFPNFRNYFNEWMPGVTDIEFPKAQYDAEVRYLDTCFAEFLTRLRELGLEEDTLVVITADHGEELDEHGLWFDHHGLYDTNLHIPLLLRCPSRLPAGVVLGGMVRQQDLPATVLDILELGDVAAQEQLQGQSYLPLIDSRSSAGTTDAIFMTENTWMKKRGIRTAEWKFIQALEHPDIHGLPPQELYDLVNDPREMNNLAGARPDFVAHFSQILNAHVAERLAATGNEDPLLAQPIPLRSI